MSSWLWALKSEVSASADDQSKAMLAGRLPLISNCTIFLNIHDDNWRVKTFTHRVWKQQFYCHSVRTIGYHNPFQKNKWIITLRPGSWGTCGFNAFSPKMNTSQNVEFVLVASFFWELNGHSRNELAGPGGVGSLCLVLRVPCVGEVQQCQASADGVRGTSRPKRTENIHVPNLSYARDGFRLYSCFTGHRD